MIYFFDAFGRITRRSSVPFDEAVHIALEGEQWIESPDIYSDETHYITYVGADETPTLTAFPPRPSDWHLWNYSTGQWELSTE